MSKNRYLYEDIQDLRIAYDRLEYALLEAFKPVLIALIWFFDRPYVVAIVTSFLCAFAVTMMIVYR